MHEDGAMRWYAVRAWPRQAEAARAELAARGVSAYAPAETVLRRIGRTKRAVRRPLWPGYMFVFCGPEGFETVRQAGGVAGFVTAAHEGARVPAALPDGALAPVVLAEAFGAFDHARARRGWSPERGERARVRTGRWRGYLGRVLSVSRRRAILQLEAGVGKLTVDPAALEAA